MKKNKGITLIALVVTIIVLLILAGISINMLTGQNGILKRATEAKKNTEDSSDLEYLRVEATSELIDYYQGNDSKNEDEYILEKWSESSNNKISVNKTDKTVTYNSKTYAMSDIIGNESEKNKINENNMNQITISTATEKKDKEILAGGKVRAIVEEDNNMRAYIPNGFYYVSGKPSNGMVISDIYGDDDNNTKGGNQFVWVPCSTDKNATEATDNGTTVTYEKVNGLATTWKSKSPGQWCYTSVPEDKKADGSYVYENGGQAITDWKDDGGNIPSVEKYGGFYIARYEAGLPENETLWSKRGGTYGWKNISNKDRNVDDMIPVSKKNNASWNRISQRNAVTVSRKMYEGSRTITSSLVDSYAWDTILAWYNKTGVNCMSSTNYGNYTDSELSLKNVLYAIHAYKDGTGWTTIASKYNYGDLTASSRTTSERIIYEIATGSAEYTKVNNIYDMAGNMWEWTTEVGDHSVSDPKPTTNNRNFAVLRGGSFPSYGGSYPVSHRDGGSSSTWEGNINIGFRVVLYIIL